MLGALACAIAGPAAADALTPWQKVRTPAPGQPRSIGEYSAGCIQGAAALPLKARQYRLRRPGGGRNFGHPELVSYVQDLGQAMASAKLETLWVGDLSQPRGGRAPGAHASHQTGLDADLFYAPPAKSGPGSVVDFKRLRVQPRLAPRTAEMLRLAASDGRVSRIFVNPVIKRELCAKESGERAWLTKIRPWYGHADHFHVRLLCPPDSIECTPQEPLPPGDGCGEDLAWWFSDAARADRDASRKKYQANLTGGAPLPAQCAALIAK